jgi:hypothetical protein
MIRKKPQDRCPHHYSIGLIFFLLVAIPSVANAESDKKERKHNLSLGLIIPLGGSSEKITPACQGEGSCSVFDILSIPGATLQYDYSLFRYFSIGISADYLSIHSTDNYHFAENLDLMLFLGGLIPLAQERLNLYSWTGWISSFFWVFEEENNEYYDFKYSALNFGSIFGGRYWIIERMAIYLDGGIRWGIVAGSGRLIGHVRLGVATRF